MNTDRQCPPCSCDCAQSRLCPNRQPLPDDAIEANVRATWGDFAWVVGGACVALLAWFVVISWAIAKLAP